jgi:hypothetical protein
MVWVAVICLLLAVAVGFLRAVSEAQKEARRQAIRAGGLPPEKIDGVLIEPVATK